MNDPKLIAEGRRHIPDDHRNSCWLLPRAVGCIWTKSSVQGPIGSRTQFDTVRVIVAQNDQDKTATIKLPLKPGDTLLIDGKPFPFDLGGEMEFGFGQVSP